MSDEDITELEDSTETLYNEIVRLYNLEMDAHDSLRDKANVIIAFSGTLITLITLALVQIKFTNKINIPSWSLVISYVPLGISLFLIIKSYYIVDLYTINAQQLLERYFGQEKSQVLAQLASNIASDLEENKKISIKRAELINISLIFLIIGIILTGIMLILIYCQPVPK